MAEYLSKMNILSQEQYDALVQSKGELYFVPETGDVIKKVEPLANLYNLNLGNARNFIIVTSDTANKQVSFSNLPTNDAVLDISVLIDFKISQSIFFPKTFWSNGTKPTFVVGHKYLVNLKTLDGGLTYLAKLANDYDMTIIKEDFNRSDGLLTGVLQSGQQMESVGGSWNIASQKLVSNTSSISNFLIADSNFGDEISLQTAIYVGTNIDAGIIFRYLNKDNYVQVTLSNGRIRIQETVNGVVGNVLYIDKPDIIKAAATVILKAEVIGMVVKAYLNNELVLTQSISVPKTHTKVGLKHYNGSTVSFDDLVVKKL